MIICAKSHTYSFLRRHIQAIAKVCASWKLYEHSNGFRDKRLFELFTQFHFAQSFAEACIHIFKNASAFLPRRAWCEAPSFLRGCDPPEAFYLSGGGFPTEINT